MNQHEFIEKLNMQVIINILILKQILCTYKCKSCGGGGGECEQGAGIWQILKFLDQIPQGGKRKVNQKCQKSPHPRGKNLNKQYYNTI